MASPDDRANEASMDPATLYREEIYTDRRIGTIRVLIPVTAMGEPDGKRETIYAGEAQVMTQMGALPISFEIDAKNLSEAVAAYGSAAKVALERTMRELQELRRQAQSGIVIPQAGGGGMPGMPGGGMPGGGKIQLP